MLILGIDPGTATTGWAVIRAEKNKGNWTAKFINFGCIMTDPKREMHHRLFSLKSELTKVTKTYKPDAVVVEQIFFGVNSRTAIMVGQARGVVMLTAAENHIPAFYEYTGLAVKLAVADSGKASKTEVQDAVRRHLSLRGEFLRPKDQTGKDVWSFRDDAYDAAAIALCHMIKSAAPTTVNVKKKSPKIAAQINK